MSLQKIAPRTVILMLIMVFVAVLRLYTLFSVHLNPISNFTPIGAMALFGGAYFKGKAKPFLFPLFTLFVSDLILSFTVFSQFRSGLLYYGWYWTYAAFTLMAIVGKLMIKEGRVKPVLASAFVATIIHWLVSDIAGCLIEPSTGAMLSVYGQRLVTAIPFELSFLAGTLIYCLLMFGSFEFLKTRISGIQIKRQV